MGTREVDLNTKELTADNWLQMDPVMRVWSLLNGETGESRQKEADDWLKEILEPRLSEAVPEDVRQQYEVARGAMAYGFFFYPLYTIGDAQLFRVADSAIYHRWVTAGSPGPGKTFKDRLERLREAGVLDGQARIRWDSVRGLRNSTSHETNQSIVTPVDAVMSLTAVAEMVEELFQAA